MPEKIILRTLRNELQNFKVETPFAMASRAIVDFRDKVSDSPYLSFAMSNFPYDSLYHAHLENDPSTAAIETDTQFAKRTIHQDYLIFISITEAGYVAFNILKALELSSKTMPNKRREINKTASSVSKILALTQTMADMVYENINEYVENGDELFDKYQAFVEFDPSEISDPENHRPTSIARNLSLKLKRLGNKVKKWEDDVSLAIMNNSAYNWYFQHKSFNTFASSAVIAIRIH